MSYKLLIVESPAKAKTVGKYLNGLGIKVVASVGHIRDLPKSNKDAIDINGGFIPHYVVSPGKEKVVKDIKELAKDADEVLLATDPDREGEAIAWHISESVGLKKPKRVVFNEITEEAILEAIKKPREIDDNLKQAQEARRVLDRLVGYDLSGLIWKKVRYGLSAGRVQSPALRIIMEREREIRAFDSKKYWVITADVKGKKKFTVTCTEEPHNIKDVEKILTIGENGEWKVKSVKETNVKRRPNAPFITSTLQQTASTRLGYSPSRTMVLAQKLYEAGHITYMRTDSTTLSKNANEQIKKVVTKNFGEELYEQRVYGNRSKNAQEAHEAIRPTKISKLTAGTTAEQKNLYSLIWARTVASQMKDAKTLRTKILVSVNDGEIPDFSVNGARIIYNGWLTADPAAKSEDTEVPEVKEGEILSLIKMYDEEKETQPPGRYTEAGLVKELEKRDIGRPSTYATIIKNITDRGYVRKEGKTLIPTDTGDVVSSFIEEHFKHYISDTFTAEMESELDDISTGKRDYVKTLKEFYTPFKKEVESKDKLEKITNLGKADDKHKCPKCNSQMEIKLGKGGKFLSCSKYPDCDGALTIEGEILKPEEPLGNHPETGDEIFVYIGQYGPYVQLGKKTKTNPKPKRAPLPKDKDAKEVTLKDAIKYLTLPRKLGEHPETGKTITASIGRFGPYIVHDKDFRSLKEDDVYTIKLERALEILKEPKVRRGRKKS